jgi:cell division septal protein FtsQ
MRMGLRRIKSTKASGGSRIPLNYYRSGPPQAAASPFIKRTSKKTGRRRKFFVRSLDLALIIVFLIGLIYSLLLQSTPSLSLNSTAYHPLSDYQAVANASMRSLKDRNKITFDQASVSATLRKEFPEIADVAVVLPVFSETAQVTVSVATPSFLLSSSGQTFVIDSLGVAIGISPTELPQFKSLTTLVDHSGFGAVASQQVLSAQTVNFIDNLLAQLNYGAVPVKSLVLPAAADELDLYTTDHAYYTKFYLGGNALLEAGQYLAARHNFASSGTQPGQYLDVRVPGKIFYK